jgi:hypothetical protein
MGANLGAMARTARYEIGDVPGARGSLRIHFFEVLREVAPEEWRNLGRMAPALWTTRYHLETPWAIDQAETTRDAWVRGHEELRRDAKVVAASVSAAMVPEPPPLEIEAWNPEGESVEEYEKRVREAARRHREEVLRMADYQQAPAFRDVKRDLRWLVQFQVQGMSWEQVATAHSAKVNWFTVRKAVERMADFLELPLRTRPRGEQKPS